MHIQQLCDFDEHFDPFIGDSDIKSGHFFSFLIDTYDD